MIRPITSRLMEAILYDMIPDFTTCVDFGINPMNPNPTFGAYQWAYRHECFTEEELDDALGDGLKLTSLISRKSKYNRTTNPYLCVIKTAYDFMKEEEDEGQT